MIDINNGIIKTVRSLSAKKYRDDENLFVAEGTKCVRDTWGHFKCRWLICTRAWHDRLATAEMHPYVVIAPNREMGRISQFTTPSDVIAVYEKPQPTEPRQEIEQGLSIMLDNVQDPGNLGTIIRLADWYGIRHIFASKGSVDVWGHKVIQATMGAVSRVQVHYGDLEDVLDDYPNLPVWGTFLQGDNIYARQLTETGFVVFGNEGQGIGAKLGKRISERLLIPAWPRTGDGSESLNVGMAASIVISEFRRQALAKI